MSNDELQQLKAAALYGKEVGVHDGWSADIVLALIAKIEASPANGAVGELPPLPEAWITDRRSDTPNHSRHHYAEDQMQAYARAAVLAASPNKDLVEALRNLTHLADEFGIKSGVCCCGDSIDKHDNPMNCGHSPVDSGEYYSDKAIVEARAALRAAGVEVA